jgi:hypothetical protein
MCLQKKVEGAVHDGADTLSSNGHEAQRAAGDLGQDISGAARDAKRTVENKAQEVRDHADTVILAGSDASVPCTCIFVVFVMILVKHAMNGAMRCAAAMGMSAEMARGTLQHSCSHVRALECGLTDWDTPLAC